MADIVCLHGAYRGGWSFAPVRRRLADLGHQVFTPSLTGMGDRAHVRPDPIGLDTWILDVVGLIEAEDLTDVVLVGHSQGGLVVSAVASRFADRLGHLVYLDAPVADAGERGVDQIEWPPPGVEVPAGTPMPVPPADAWFEARPLDASSGLDPAMIAWANQRLCATPVGPSLDVVLGGPVTTPATYVFCADTPAAYPSSVTRRRFEARGVEHRVVDAPHDLMLGRPDLAVELIVGAATR